MSSRNEILSGKTTGSMLSTDAVALINKIVAIEFEFPGLVKAEFLDFLDVFADSARVGKYPLNNWLEPNGRKADKVNNYSSIGRHIEQEKAGIKADHDSGRPPKLHAIARLSMDHVRDSRGVIHPLDNTGIEL